MLPEVSGLTLGFVAFSACFHSLGSEPILRPVALCHGETYRYERACHQSALRRPGSANRGPVLNR